MSKLEKVCGVLLRQNDSVEVRFTSELDILGNRENVLEYTIIGTLFDEMATSGLSELIEAMNELSVKKTAVQGRTRKGGAK